MKIKEFAKIYNGSTPSTKEPKNYDGKIIWITPKDLSDQKCKYVIRGERNITQQGYDSCSTMLLPPNSLLLTSRAPIGLLAINKTECCTNQGFKNLVIDENKCLTEYLYYYFKTQIRNFVNIAGGTTFKEISKQVLENFDVYLPPLDIQRKIVSILKPFDDLIENNIKINFILEKTMTLLFDYWFLQFNFPDNNHKPFKDNKGKIKIDSKTGISLPDGWSIIKIKDLVTINSGTKYANFGSPILNKFRYFTCSSDILWCNESEFESPSIIVSTHGDFKVDYSFSPFNAYFCNAILTLKNIENLGFLYFYLKKYLPNLQRQSGGSIIKFINNKEINEICVCFPNQTYLFNVFSDALKIIENNIKENAKLGKLRDLILPMLMNGQIKVK